jgi:hypothetical protein
MVNLILLINKIQLFINNKQTKHWRAILYIKKNEKNFNKYYFYILNNNIK